MHGILAVLFALLLSGCASLQYAGVASYSVEPVDIGGEIHCCRVTIHNGKEIDRLDALVEKRGDDYTVSLKQWNVDSFRGQQIAAGAVRSSASLAGKAATAAAAAALIPSAGAALASPGIGAAAAGAGALAVGQKLAE